MPATCRALVLVLVVELALGASPQPWQGVRAWVDGELYRAQQNATRMYFSLRGDYDPRTDTVEATQEKNLECAGTFPNDLQPWQCVSSNKIGHFLWRKWIPGREVLAEEKPRIRGGQGRLRPPPPPGAPPPPPPPPSRPMGPPPAPPDMIPTLSTNAYEVPLLPQSTLPDELNWQDINRASRLPASFIEAGHYYHPGVWSHHRSVMADFVAYLLSRPKHAVPYAVRELLVWKPCCWKTCPCHTADQWPGDMMPRSYFMPKQLTPQGETYVEQDVEPFEDHQITVEVIDTPPPPPSEPVPPISPPGPPPLYPGVRPRRPPPSPPQPPLPQPHAPWPPFTPLPPPWTPIQAMLKDSLAASFMVSMRKQATPPPNAAAIAVAREDSAAAGPLWKARSGPLTEPGDAEPWRLPDEVDPRAAVYEAVTMPSTRRHVIKALRKRNGRLDAIKAAALRALEQDKNPLGPVHMHHQPSISRRLLATSPMVQLMLPPIPGTAARSAYDGLGNFTDTTALKKLRAEKLRAKTIPPPPLPSVNNMIRYSDDLVKTALNIITKDFELNGIPVAPPLSTPSPPPNYDLMVSAALLDMFAPPPPEVPVQVHTSPQRLEDMLHVRLQSAPPPPMPQVVEAALAQALHIQQPALPPPLPRPTSINQDQAWSQEPMGGLGPANAAAVLRDDGNTTAKRCLLCQGATMRKRAARLRGESQSVGQEGLGVDMHDSAQATSDVLRGQKVMSKEKGDEYDFTTPQSWDMLAAPTGTPDAQPVPTSTTSPTSVFKELEHESQDSFWPPEEDETPVHGADLMTRFLALLGCLMPIVVLYYVKRAMGAPPHPQGHDDNINALQSTAAGPVASDREFGLTLSELTALQAKKMMADKQSHLQRMSSYRFDRRANQGKQRMGGTVDQLPPSIRMTQALPEPPCQADWQPCPTQYLAKNKMHSSWERRKAGAKWEYRRTLDTGMVVTAPTVIECKKVDSTLIEAASPTSAPAASKRTTASTPVQPTPSTAKRARGASGSIAFVVTGSTPRRALKAPISKGKKKSNAVDVNPNPKKRKNARPARAPARRACMVVNYKEVVDEDDGASDGDASMDQEDEVEGEDEEDEAMSLEDEEEEAFAKRKGKATANADSKRKPKGKGSAFVKKLTDEEQAALPVLTNPYDMFLDMVGNTPEIADVVKQLQGRPIRVATMCSGTESPLLALDMISRAVQERYNSKLEVEHVFSCEIEPFKQAYIERNFQPPKLFRDVRELCNKFATTAYGALLPVPGDVDILVAGTSCVDYSNLNNERKGLDDGGESGQTFKGMMEWIKRAKPPVVILENVCNAPWEAVAERFRDNGYHATYQRLDTKQYYIPHTRTRVYLFATLIDKFGKADVSEQWKEMVKHLQRPSSATLEAFLLPVDDPRVHRAREDLGSTVRENRKVTDWGRCESRHQRARAEEGLGNKRPLTGWEEGGNCKLVEYAWHDWGSTQVDRVLDLMDINALRLGATGVDATQKCMVWNLSQNVDRTTGSNKPGICPCLTPSMVPYVTNRGGPLVGIEALSLQGIPVDDLLLTRESEDQMADLAGNAMTSTVVGACMLSALILGNHSLLAHQRTVPKAVEGTPATAKELCPASVVVHEKSLSKTPLPLSELGCTATDALLNHAALSARMCTCEGRAATAAEVLTCEDCGTSVCVSCAGRPEHSFPPGVVTLSAQRVSPDEFEAELKAALPMVVKASGLDLKSLGALKPLGVDEALWREWLAVVSPLHNEQFFFSATNRAERWTATYKAKSGRMELALEGGRLTWNVWAQPRIDTAPGLLADYLAHPILRMTAAAPSAAAKGKKEVANGAGPLFQGQWQVCVPKDEEFKILITGTGELRDTWESRMGLIGKHQEFVGKKRWSSWKVEMEKGKAGALDLPIAGTYRLLEKCAGPMNALHRRVVSTQRGDDSEAAGGGMYLFQDPTRCGDASDDGFVFAQRWRRLAYGEERGSIASLDKSWRPTDVNGKQQVACKTRGRWVDAPVCYTAVACNGATVAIPTKPLLVKADTADSCASAVAVLECMVPLPKDATAHGWVEGGEWEDIPLQRSKAKFESIAWFTERLALPPTLRGWAPVVGGGDGAHACSGKSCARCAPAMPQLQFVTVGRQVEAREDVRQAGEYEQALKRRPAAFVVQQKTCGGKGAVRIGVNAASLMHRALAMLPTRRDAHGEGQGDVSVTWRLVQHVEHKAQEEVSAPLRLMSNKLDKPQGQPPHFKKYLLRPEQQRSLGWMLKQEASTEKFVEEEVEEAVLPALRWRAEGRAERAVLVRGGIVADQVGYGKTAITVGLIDSAPPPPAPSAFASMHAVPVKATLVFAPPHLLKQWPREVVKFTANGLKMLVVNTMGDLNRLTVAAVEEADIVVVATSLLRSDLYFARLGNLAGVMPLPAKSGRHFTLAYEEALRKLEVRVAQVKGLSGEKNGVAAAWAEIQQAAIERAAPAPVLASALGTTAKRMLTTEQLLTLTKKQSYKLSKKEAAAAAAAAAAGTKEAEAADTLAGSDGAPSLVHKSQSKKTGATKRTLVRATQEKAKSKAPTVKSEAQKAVAAAAKTASKRARNVAEDSGGARKITRPRRTSMGACIVDESDAEGTAEEDEYQAESEPESEVLSECESEDSAVVRPKKKGKGANGKAAKAKPAAKVKKEDGELADVWGLSDAKVQKDWKQMCCMPLEGFHWARVVVDEFTYLKERDRDVVLQLKSSFRWCLSGTPPVKDFDDVKGVASFLGVHLGVNEAPACTKKEQTRVEKFNYFREMHTPAWHARRHRLAQTFLDRFVRQNVAEIDEIQWQEQNMMVQLPPAERAIYLELQHHLQAMEMKTVKTVKRGKKESELGDKEGRLREVLGASGSPEEALLKRCSHFDLSSAMSSAQAACTKVVELRKEQLEDCKEELACSVRNAEQLLQAIHEKDTNFMRSEADYYTRWKTEMETYNEDEAGEAIRAIMKKEGKGEVEEKEVATKPKTESAKAKAALSKAKKAEKEVVEEDDDDEEEEEVEGKPKPESAKAKAAFSKAKKAEKELDDRKWELRELTHTLRRLQKELVGRTRALRFFSAVRSLQEKDVPVQCACGKKDVSKDDAAVLSCCGHQGCVKCLKEAAHNQECNVRNCSVAARTNAVVTATFLGAKEEHGKGGRYGAKLLDIVKKINTIDASERILVFVQFPDLMQKVADALAEAGIGALQLQGSVHTKTRALDQFQEEKPLKKGDPRVLLLNLKDESASGANLTTANHAIFVHPLLTTTQQEFEACETQAIGRVRRYGQTRKVHLWRFLASETIDTEIYKQRVENASGK